MANQRAHSAAACEGRVEQGENAGTTECAARAGARSARGRGVELPLPLNRATHILLISPSAVVIGGGKL
jgi:hypothetical protein